jgi:excisionase family DNA binding protein
MVESSNLSAHDRVRKLRIHPKTLRNKARRGVIPGVQVGRLWRFRASALNEWLDEIAS